MSLLMGSKGRTRGSLTSARLHITPPPACFLSRKDERAHTEGGGRRESEDYDGVSCDDGYVGNSERTLKKQTLHAISARTTRTLSKYGFKFIFPLYFLTHNV